MIVTWAVVSNNYSYHAMFFFYLIEYEDVGSTKEPRDTDHNGNSFLKNVWEFPPSKTNHAKEILFLS